MEKRNYDGVKLKQDHIKSVLVCIDVSSYLEGCAFLGWLLIVGIYKKVSLRERNTSNSVYNTNCLPTTARSSSTYHSLRTKMASPLPYNRQNALASTIAVDNASNIAGKIVITTGVTQGGLGATFVEEVAKHKPALLILAGRSPSKVQVTADKIRSNPASANVEVRILALDLASQKQIREAAKEVLAYPESNIDILVNSAGTMAGPYRTTAEGIESQF